MTPSVTSLLFITSIIARLYESAQVNVSLNMVIEGMSLWCFYVCDKIKDAVMKSDAGIKDCVFIALFK